MDTPVIHSEKVRQPFSGYIMLAFILVLVIPPNRKAAMVSNLMVVLCGDRESQPVVNTGTLNH